jgi:hypothetical protein
MRLRCASSSATIKIAFASAVSRHFTEGQQAMAVAMLHPEPTKGGARKKGVSSQRRELPGVSQRSADNLISQARSVLREAPGGARWSPR